MEPIPVPSFPVPDAVRVRLVIVRGAPSRLVSWNCSTGTLTDPGN